jgi:hypothetical protein
MTANPVLSEIERINRNEQIAEWDKNEKAIAGQLPPFSQRPLNEQESLALNPFLKWCRLNGVRHCPAKPTTVAGFISEHRAEPVETLLAIERMHDIHNLPNPVTTAGVRAVLASIIDFEPPRSWSLQEKAKFIEIPAELREIIARRTKQRETEFRRLQNQLAELRKKTNVESKTEGADPQSTTRQPEGTECTGSPGGNG